MGAEQGLDIFSSLTSSTRLFLAVVLLLGNAFFVAVEFSLVRVRKTRLQELARKGSLKARDVLTMQETLGSYLSA